MNVEAGQELSVAVKVERRDNGLHAWIEAVNLQKRVKCTRTYAIGIKSAEEIARSFVLDVAGKFTAFKGLNEFVERQIAGAIRAESMEPL